MKTAYMLIISLVYFWPALANAQEKTQAKERSWEKLTPFERAKKSARIQGSRKIKIHPVAQKDGIKTGCVIAYGHYLRPPYVLAYENSKLFVNGVQVEPSQLVNRESLYGGTASTAALNAAQSRMDTANTIREKYQKEKGKKADTQLRTDLVSFAKSQKGVLDAKWEKDGLMISYVNGVGFGFVELEEPKQPMGWKKRTQLAANQEAETKSLGRIAGALKSGECVVFTGDAGTMMIRNPREQVVRIMENSTLSPETKSEMLSKEVFLGSYKGAFDLIENYDPQEWKSGE